MANNKLTPELIKLLDQKEDLSNFGTDELLKEFFKRKAEGNIKVKFSFVPSENQIEVKFEDGGGNNDFNITLMNNDADIKAWCQALISYEQRGTIGATRQEKKNRLEFYHKVLDALERKNPKLAEIIKSEREKQKKINS